MLNEESVKEIMNKRGYSLVSTSMKDNKILNLNFAKQNQGFTLNAQVNLEHERIQLIFVDLFYFCQLSTSPFAFDHKDFDNFEMTLTGYRSVCEIYDARGEVVKRKESVKEPADIEKNIKTRKDDLWNIIRQVGKEKEYPKESCQAFFLYWTEKNPKGKKMRFEMEKVFDVSRRLLTWMNNDKRWLTQKKDFVDKKIEKQDAEMKKTKKVINPKDLF